MLTSIFFAEMLDATKKVFDEVSNSNERSILHENLNEESAAIKKTPKVGETFESKDVKHGKTTTIKTGDKQSSNGGGEANEFVKGEEVKIPEVKFSPIDTANWKDVVNQTMTQAMRAAIMSRNISHNLGSHVMAYLKQRFDSCEEIKKTWDSACVGEKGDSLTAYLVGVGKFIGYLQERQEYIASVSTTYIPIATPVDFKDAIFDCLNHDLKSDRHNTIDPSINILLSYIALSEGFYRKANEKNTLRVIFENEGGKVITGYKYFDTVTESNVDDIRNFEFALPSGLVGRQAIFSIIENLIRNAAKHEKQANKSLDIRLSICDGTKLERFWCFRDKTDKASYLDEKILLTRTQDISDLMLFTISYKTSSKNERMNALVRQLRKGMGIPYVNDGVPDERSRGLKEIRISASWLRGDFDENKYLGYNIENERCTLRNDNNKKAPLVYITGNSDGDLFFTIFLKKCLQVAYLQEGMTAVDIENFRNKGWKPFSSKDKLKESEYTFEYIVVANLELYNELRPFTSNKLLVWNINNEIRSFLEKNNWGKECILRVLYSLHTHIPIYPKETIFIWDSNEVWRNKMSQFESDDGICLIKTLMADPLDETRCSAKYVYRTHHESESHGIDSFLESAMPHRAIGEGSYSNILFVEGISGGNSSHRLVRHVPLDYKWYYEHLYAMQMQVAIFDERLFEAIHHQCETDVISGIKVKVFNTNKKGQKVLNGDCYKSVVYEQKGINVFTIAQDSSTNLHPSWAVIGCVVDWAGESCIYQKIASINCDNNGKISINKICDFRYDFITIHQGLLDKLYASFNCKNIERNIEENVRGKFLITNELYKEFIKSPHSIQIDNDRDYYVYNTNLFIHSGRGLISKDNMPQPQPFIQYSAISQAVYDCKYVLIELLEHSKYSERK